MRTTHATELAWAAGLYDGEGCTTLSVDRRPGGYSSLRVQVNQAHRTEVLERFAIAVGKPRRIVGPYDCPNETYYFQAVSEDALDIIFEMWPHLSAPKREQAQRVIDAWYVDLAKPRVARLKGVVADKRVQLRKQIDKWRLTHE